MRKYYIIYNRKIIEINIIVLTIIFYLFRTTLPFLKFPFILLFFILVVFAIANYRTKISLQLKLFFRHFYLPLVLAAILLISFLFSDKLYLSIFKDTTNALILIFVFFLMTIYIDSKIYLNLFFKYFIKYTIVCAILISLILLGNYFNVFSSNEKIATNSFAWSAFVRTLSLDYNFALVPVFFGMIGILYLLTESRDSFRIVFLNLILVIFSTTIIFSGSRRGLTTLLILISFLFIIEVYSLCKKDTLFRKIAINSRIFVVMMIVIPSLLIGFVFVLPVQIKRLTLNSFGIPVRAYKEIIALRLFKYSTFFSNKDFLHFQETVWNEPLNSLNPDSGWDERYGFPVFPLSGKNVEIIPENAIGYKMDSTCNASTWDGNSYSFTSISGLFKADLYPANDELYYASVYCFVSKDFDGTWVVLSDKDGAGGRISQKYDLSRIGTWQKLQVDFRSDSGIIPIYLYWSKFGVKDFSQLKGNVIFAYPEYRIKKENDLSLLRSEATEKIEFINLCISNKLNEKNPRSTLLDQFSLKPRSTEFAKVAGKAYKSIIIHKYNNSINNSGSFRAGFSLGYLTNLRFVFTNGIQKDPIRRWASELIIEDTTYHAYKANLVVDSTSNVFLSPRTMRWQFAEQIYLKEFNWKQKIFGGGFNFLNWFGIYFLNDKNASDYPHNPFLSILLYSGIIGLIIYLIFMYNVFYYYIKYYRDYQILVIFFLLTFFFSFFSAGSPFDPPVMGFFSILPFFINYINKKSVKISD